ncbi:MAG: DUF4292 domain-containing protein [Bacteroidaceae bacterium]|nr:DUF4292 domain-containing protein [Bacteroidaceae bacterium]
MNKTISILLTATLLLTTACGTKRAALENGGSSAQAVAQTAEAATAAFVRSVEANNLTTDALTAKLSMDLTVGSKNVGLTGSLKMKRDEVIQLSLVLLFVEVARIEFSPKEVLIIDRVHKQYVRAAYSDVSFLAQAGLDFHALQSLFWHELFVPGESAAKISASRFRLSSAGDHTLLSLTDAPKLNYEFLTVTKNHLIDRLNVEGKTTSDRGKFLWRYDNFAQVSGKPFPKKMSLSVSGVGKEIAADIELSSLGTDNKWNAHTTPSSSYRQREASDILRSLF